MSRERLLVALAFVIVVSLVVACTATAGNKRQGVGLAQATAGTPTLSARAQTDIPLAQTAVRNLGQTAAPAIETAAIEGQTALPQLLTAIPQLQTAAPTIGPTVQAALRLLAQTAVPRVQTAVPMLQTAVPQLQTAAPELLTCIPQRTPTP